MRKYKAPHTYVRVKEITSNGDPYTLKMYQWYDKSDYTEAITVKIMARSHNTTWTYNIHRSKDLLPFDISSLYAMANRLTNVCDKEVSQCDLINFIIENYLAQGLKYTVERMSDYFDVKHA